MTRSQYVEQRRHSAASARRIVRPIARSYPWPRGRDPAGAAYRWPCSPTAPPSCSWRTTPSSARSSPTTSPPTATSCCVADSVREGLRLLERRRPGPRGHRRRAARRLGARAGAAGAGGRRRRLAAGPVAAACVDPVGPRRRARPHARLRARCRRLRGQAVLLRASCGCASPRCCAARSERARARAPARRRAGDRPGGRASRTLRGRRVELSAKEFALLRTLAAEPTRVFTKERAAARRLGLPRARHARARSDSHACRLRRKLGARRRPLRRQRVGRRLPARRRAGARGGELELPTEAHRAPARAFALVEAVGVGARLGRIEFEVGCAARARPTPGLVEQLLADAARAMVGVHGEILDPDTPAEAHRLELVV